MEWNVIHAYTRAQALADGNLVKVPEPVCSEAGIRVPVALTRAVWEGCVAWTEADGARTGALQDEDGRLWDVVWMTRSAISRNRGRSRAEVELYRVPRDGHSVEPELVKLVAVIGPGDEGEPVLTVMEPNEA